MSSPPPGPSAIAELDVALGADRAFALQQMPGRVRSAVEALWLLDAAMGNVVARSTDPLLGRIKLAWWREQLERLDGAPPPAEPRLQAVARELVANDITGAVLAGLEAGWATMLDAEIEPDLVGARGARLFAITGRLLGSDDPALAEAGALHVLASAARRGLPGLLPLAADHRRTLSGHRFAGPVRVLSMLARASARDLSGPPFEPEGGRRRLLAMLVHRWSGRL